MYNKYGNYILLAVAIAVVGFAAGAQAEVLFSDNFNGAVAPAAPDYSLNDNLSGRLGGYLKPTLVGQGKAWERSGVSLGTTDTPSVSTVDRIQVNNSTYGSDVMVIGSMDSRDGTYSTLIQQDFAAGAVGGKIAAAGGFTIRWDMDPLPAGSSGTSKRYGGGVIIGAMDGTQSNLDPTAYADRHPSTDPHAELTVELNDGAYVAGQGATVLARSKGGKASWSSTSDIPTYDANPPANFDRWYTFELRVETTSFAENAAASASLWWGLQGTTSENLVQADLTGLDPTGKSFSWTWDADGSCYIGLFGYTKAEPGGAFTNVTVFDNVSIFAVPEPSTFALLACGLFGLLAYAWRKRK